MIRKLKYNIILLKLRVKHKTKYVNLGVNVFYRLLFPKRDMCICGYNDKLLMVYMNGNQVYFLLL